MLITKTLCVCSIGPCGSVSTKPHMLLCVCFLILASYNSTIIPTRPCSLPKLPLEALSEWSHHRRQIFSHHGVIVFFSHLPLTPPAHNMWLDTADEIPRRVWVWQAKEVSHMLRFPWHAHPCHRRCLSLCGNHQQPLL